MAWSQCMTTIPRGLLNVKLIEPPCTERYARWCERSANQLMISLLLDFFPGIFTRKQSGTMLCLSAETEAVRRDTPMCEERQTHSDRTLPGLTSPIRSAMRETATSSLSLKHRLTCYHSSAFIRRTGRKEIILPWAAFRAKLLTVFFLNARTPKKCSSALTATPQEAKPVPDWHSPFPARSPSFALSRQGKTGTMFSVSKGTFPAANS